MGRTLLSSLVYCSKAGPLTNALRSTETGVRGGASLTKRHDPQESRGQSIQPNSCARSADPTDGRQPDQHLLGWTFFSWFICTITLRGGVYFYLSFTEGKLEVREKAEITWPKLTQLRSGCDSSAGSLTLSSHSRYVASLDHGSRCPAGWRVSSTFPLEPPHKGVVCPRSWGRGVIYKR